MLFFAKKKPGHHLPEMETELEAVVPVGGKAIGRVRALFDFVDEDGDHDNYLAFAEGDVVVLHGKPDEDWWEGELSGRRGLFPSNFVEEI